MLIDHKRDKLINAIIYFATNTNNCGKVRLFKLLYFLDFEHFSETGRSVTGLDYYAWDKGPCPRVLFDEIQDATKLDIKEKIEFGMIPTSKGEMLQIRPLKEFDPSHFSKRELRLMQNLANEFKNARAEEMIEASHLENLPWHQVYEVQNKKNALIPYEYALKRQEKEEMHQHIKDTNEFWKDFE